MYSYPYHAYACFYSSLFRFKEIYSPFYMQLLSIPLFSFTFIFFCTSLPRPPLIFSTYLLPKMCDAELAQPFMLFLIYLSFIPNSSPTAKIIPDPPPIWMLESIGGYLSSDRKGKCSAWLKPSFLLCFHILLPQNFLIVPKEFHPFGISPSTLQLLFNNYGSLSPQALLGGIIQPPHTVSSPSTWSTMFTTSNSFS